MVAFFLDSAVFTTPMGDVGHREIRVGNINQVVAMGAANFVASSRALHEF
jgi:hypothetical protein